MARKTREEKTIEHANLTLEDFHKLYNDNGRAVIEYEKLLKEYKKLNTRFSKTIHMNDKVGRSVINNNEQLKENVDYTVKTARKRILYNIEEHRKTKKTLANHSKQDKETIQRLKKELKDIREYVHQLEYKSNHDDIVKHQFDAKNNIIVQSTDINPDDIKNFSYESILKQKIEYSKSNDTNLTIAKLTIDNWSTVIGQLDDINSDKEKVLKMFYKFFSVSLGPKNIVYYFKDNIYYFIFNNCDIEDSKVLLSKVNVPKKLSNITFTFSIGVAQFEIKNDNIQGINDKCNNANLEASKVTDNKSTIIYF